MTKPTDTNIIAIAAAAHLVNRAWCIAHGDDSQPLWADAPNWQKESALAGVTGALAGATPEQSHEGWMKQKQSTGWVYGPTKDPDRKTHPCMVPYADLPAEQKKKDDLFVSTVREMGLALGISD